MEFLKSAKSLRFVAGGALFALGYLPVFWSSLNNSVINFVNNDGVIAQDECIRYVPFDKPIMLSEQMDHILLAQSAQLEEVGSEEIAEVENTAEDIKVAEAAEKHLKDITFGPFKGGKIAKGQIQTNFYVDARKLGIPAKVVDKVVKTLSAKVNFRRSLKQGDKFEIVFGEKKDLLYAKVSTRKKAFAVYKFENGYCFDNGEKISASRSVSSSFGAPLRGRPKITSYYGYRLHPVYRTRKKHTGVDYSAMYGTPVYAVYDGIVTRASIYSGYGKCVDIQHRNGYSSRYAHLSRFAVRNGSHVKKGQLIAYSGNSGVSTGPHLHLELARNNTTINPLSVKMMPSEPVARVSNMKKFKALKDYSNRL